MEFLFQVQNQFASCQVQEGEALVEFEEMMADPAEFHAQEAEDEQKVVVNLASATATIKEGALCVRNS